MMITQKYYNIDEGNVVRCLINFLIGINLILRVLLNSSKKSGI